MIYALQGRALVTEGETFVAPTAVLIGAVRLQHESSVWWGAVLRGDYDTIAIGKRSNVQDNAVIHMDEGFPVTIGDCVTIGHKAVLHGCSIGNNRPHRHQCRRDERRRDRRQLPDRLQRADHRRQGNPAAQLGAGFAG